eukprot:7775268-Alexandrium_andersonii.AAC.1
MFPAGRPAAAWGCVIHRRKPLNRRCAIHGCGSQHSVARSLQRLLRNRRDCKLVAQAAVGCCLLYTSDAADDM